MLDPERGTRSPWSTPLRQELGATAVGRILVPTNYSAACSEMALEYAKIFAWRAAVSIELLYVADPPRAGSAGRTESLADSWARVPMLQALSRTHRHGNVAVRGRLKVGPVCETIPRVATIDHVDLNVLGSCDGPQGEQSIARRVARVVPCPVVCLRASADPGPTTAGMSLRAVRTIMHAHEGRSRASSKRLANRACSDPRAL